MGLGTEGGLAISPRLSPVEYEQLISGIREVVHRVVPLNATVLVVSRGDEELVKLGPRAALHFPQEEDGRYAGYHPADSDDAIRMLEEHHAKGADYLLLPSTGFWWLDFYAGFRRYLEQRYQVVESNEHCWIAKLSEALDVDSETAFAAEAPRALDRAHPLNELIAALLPTEAEIVFLATVAADTARLGGHRTWLMPKEASADSNDVMDSLLALERSGMQFVVIPATAFEWLGEHPEVAKRLRSNHRFVTRQEHLCEIYELQPPHVEHRHDAGDAAPAAIKRSFGDTLRKLFSARRNGNRS